ncbi:peptidoglycan editing factor PgeF [Sphingomonas sp. KRR8]|uniref:peptidoglycan editing factor PgeF n=1 Tax=Sphingomonas sp. KRR8 TaxID=2942996 RepID=UPI0032E8033F
MTDLALTVRPATAADLPDIDRVFDTSFCDTFAHLYDPRDLQTFLGGFTLDDWRAEFDNPLFAFQVGELDGEIVGYAKVGPNKLPYVQSEGTLELKQLYLLKTAHGTGLAQQLMAWVMEEARRRSARRVALSVFSENFRAQAFYAKYGFTDRGPVTFMVGDHPDEDRVWAAELTPARLWRAQSLSGVPHGFFGRVGGISTGAMASLNCGWGSGEDLHIVRVNRRIAADAVLPGARIVSPHQIHSAAVVEAGEWPDHDRPHADAVVTDRPGQLLGILTADCTPVLLADAEAGVIGAAHAGWKGAIAGVTDSTIAAMERLGARRERIVAAVGPCIAQRSYEVDYAFPEAFTANEPEADRFFTEGPAGKPHFDLESYVVARLARAGLRQVEALGQDTYAQPDLFYSYRRATHLGEPSYGRQISLIGMTP